MLVLWLSSSASGQQLVLDLDDGAFCGDLGSALTANGTARFERGSPCALQLTRTGGDDVGSAWTKEPVPISELTMIRSRFHLSMTGAAPINSSGMTFTWQAEGVGALGGDGQNLGYGGISDSVALEFDTYESPGDYDPDDNHIGLDVDGEVESVDLVDPGLELNRPDGFWVWVEIHQGDRELTVWVAPGPVQPADPVLSRTLDLLDRVGNTPRVGFTAANGGSGWTDLHRVESWLLEVDEDADGDHVMDFEDPCWLGGGEDFEEQDTDQDGVCDTQDVCQDADDTLDDDDDGVPDCLESAEDGPEPPGGSADRASTRRGRATDVGCGCRSGAQGPWLMGLLVLALLRRRE